MISPLRTGLEEERGSATVELTWLVLLLLVPFGYAVLAVFDAQRAAYAASSASVAGARAFTQAADAQSAEQRAQRAAELAWTDFGLDTTMDVTVRCEPECFVPGSTVEVKVEARQSLPLVPDAWGTSLAAIDVNASHVEPFGSYRAAR